MQSQQNCKNLCDTVESYLSNHFVTNYPSFGYFQKNSCLSRNVNDYIFTCWIAIIV